jgi:hypothetical protein
MSENMNNRQLALRMATEIVKAQCGSGTMNYYDVMELANHMFHFLDNIAYKRIES